MNDLIPHAYARYQAGDLAGAEKAVRQALAQNPNTADAWLLLGVLADHARVPKDAEQFLLRAAELNPADPRIWNTLGTVRDGAGDLDGAREAYETGLRSNPNYAAAWHNLGEVHRALGRHSVAAEHYRKALAIDPHLAPAWSNLLFSLHFDPNLSDAQIHAEHLKWGEALAARTPALPPPTNDADPDRVLKVGYIGPDFREHAVARFFEPLLASHDRTRFQFVMYSECPIIDDVGQRLRTHGDTFRIIRGHSADDVCQTIRADGIDILIDLAGHTRDNRLDVLALRSAPLQMTFLGYPFGTGLPRIDYRITDGVLDPLDAEPRLGGAESLLRLPEGVCCFQPPRQAPPVNDLPMLKNGYVTFGCHHPLPKLNPGVLKLWAEVAQAVPTAKFLCVRNTWDGAPARELRQRLQDAGLPLDRVELRKSTIAPGEYLRAFHDMDVVLDASPFNGHTMTCEALWMGVPVLTISGDRPAGRLTTSVLRALGLEMFVAADRREFVEKAGNLPSIDLARLRSTLRDRVADTIGDAPRYARSLEGLLRDAWRTRCRGERRGVSPQIVSSEPSLAPPGERRGVSPPSQDSQQGSHALAASHGGLTPHRSPNTWDEVHARGCSLLEGGNADDAAILFREASSLNPLAVPPRAMLAGILSDRCDLIGAAEQYQFAMKAGPDAKVRIAAALALPPIYDSVEQIAECRATLLKNIETLHADGVTLDPMRGPIPNLFLAAYQGMNDKHLMGRYAKLFGPSPWAREPVTPLPGERIRIGLISQYFCNHTIGTLNRGLVEKLDRNRFHVTIFSATSTEDDTSKAYREFADEFVPLPGETASAVRLIRSRRLNVALFADLGMSCVTLALAHARLAPRQAVTWGHPLTTGISTVDDFLSSPLYEGAEAQEHYTERLVPLPGLNTYYFRPVLDRTYRRDEFKLPEDANLYGCPQTLFKFHPDFDGILAEILRDDPRGHLVLIEGRNLYWKERLLRRWRGTLPLERIHWIGALPRPAFLGLCSVCDVMLDPPHFGGGNTSLEALALGVPVVTLPSPFLRARLTAGFYRHIGFTELIAANAGEYVRTALKLTGDGAYRAHVRQRMDVVGLFENTTSVQGFEEYFEGR